MTSSINTAPPSASSKLGQEGQLRAKQIGDDIKSSIKSTGKESEGALAATDAVQVAIGERNDAQLGNKI